MQAAPPPRKSQWNLSTAGVHDDERAMAAVAAADGASPPERYRDRAMAEMATTAPVVMRGHRPSRFGREDSGTRRGLYVAMCWD